MTDAKKKMEEIKQKLHLMSEMIKVMEGKMEGYKEEIATLIDERNFYKKKVGQLRRRLR